MDEKEGKKTKLKPKPNKPKKTSKQNNKNFSEELYVFRHSWKYWKWQFGDFFKLSGSWLSLEQKLYKFLFDCHLQIIWLLLNRALYVVLITGGRLEIRNSTLKAVKVSLKLMCIGSKGGILSRWSSVSSKKKKKPNKTKPQIISKVLSFSCSAQGFNLQFCVLLGWNLNLPVKNNLYHLLVLLLQMESYSPPTAIDVWFGRKNQMRIPTKIIFL